MSQIKTPLAVFRAAGMVAVHGLIGLEITAQDAQPQQGG